MAAQLKVNFTIVLKIIISNVLLELYTTSLFRYAITTTTTSRHDQVTISRLRTGHHLSFRAYQHRLDPLADTSCPRCDFPTHDLSHWMKCPGTEATRRELFAEEMHDGITLLCRHPTLSLRLTRSTLLEHQQ